ncbi:neprilysin-4-like [Haematobia irritans]|uniref:neprilysin-4-like n=1 Tax=Haematobia irritans TaxID=7368 RepID=UPI003F504375
MYSTTFRWTLLCILVVGISRFSTVAYDLNIESIRHAKVQTMLKYMNPNVDPCSNFYEFACGNWPQIYPANLTNQLETNTLQLIQSEVDQVMLYVLSDGNVNLDSPIDKKVKNFYHSCMNMRNSEPRYKRQLREIIDEFGQMPALVGQQWSEDNFDWLKTVADIAKKYDINIILGRYIRPDLRNKKKHVLSLDIPTFGLDRIDLYLDPANGMFINDYFSGIVQHLFQYLDLDVVIAQAVAREILGFEMAMVMGAANESDHFSHTYGPIKKLDENYGGSLNLEKYLEMVQGSVPKGDILDKSPEYHMNLVKVIKRFPKRVMANYIYYSLIRHFMISPPPMSYEELQMSCVTLTRSHFGDVVDSMVYRKIDVKDAQQAVTNMVYDLKTVFEFSLRNPDYHWIERKIQKRIVEKLRAMKLIFKTYETNNFSWKYGTIIIDIKDLVGNLKSVYLIRGLSAKSKLNGRVEVDYEQETPLAFLPKYIVEHNALVIPVGFLQPRLFWSQPYPPAINLGQMGFFLAHEFIHAIDKDGVQFDNTGLMRFWFDGAYKELNQRMECFTNQYKGYIYGGAELPELLSQAENIADASGLRLAYRTYMAWQNNPYRGTDNRTIETFPGLKYSGKQLFFISFAQLWCSDVNSQLTNMPIVVNGENAPGSFKVMGILSHLKEFSEVFQCPENGGGGAGDTPKCFVY